MDFLKNIFYLIKKKLKNGLFFNSSRYKMKKLLCGFGNSKINMNTIEIENYPFEPAIVFPYKIIDAKEIDAIQIDASKLRSINLWLKIQLDKDLKKCFENICTKT